MRWFRPNFEKLSAKRDVKGLFKALTQSSESEIVKILEALEHIAQSNTTLVADGWLASSNKVRIATTRYLPRLCGVACASALALCLSENIQDLRKAASRKIRYCFFEVKI